MGLSKLIRFTLFLFLFVGIGSILMVIGFDYLYQKNQYGMSGGNINYYLQNVEKPEYLIMGSSRAHHTLIPDSISVSTFNLSHNGMSLGFHTALLDVLEKENHLPRSGLILQIEPEEFFRSNSQMGKDVQFLKYYYKKNDFIRNRIGEIGRFESLKYFLDLHSFNGNVLSLVKNYLMTLKNGIPDNNGFVPITPTD
ncbi:hypothetical protein, partial [Xanthovirga aplysinae]|uniref:hypothetical protein n=1 Tax=Xanthovirga aplysinae TaxID=2529853 RepID=UPI0012BB6E41